MNASSNKKKKSAEVKSEMRKVFKCWERCLFEPYLVGLVIEIM